MASSQSWRGLDALKDIHDWMAQRNEDVHRLAHGAEAAGRQAWSEGTRAGRNVLAQTSAQVRALGAGLSGGGGARQASEARPLQNGAGVRSSAPSAASPNAESALASWGRQAGDQVLAAARGAQDTFTFGLGDRGYAGVEALIDAAHGEDIGSAFHRRMDMERARDRYDTEHYGAARTVGQIAGAVAQLPALGWIEGPAVGVRLAESAPLLMREAGAVAGAGAAFGVGGQAVSDITHRRLSSVGDYGGAALGGSVGAGASLFGPARYAGMVDGAVTSAAQDVLNGRTPSVSRATQAAGAGGIFGAGAGRIGTRWANNLGAENGVLGQARAKGYLGESLARFRLMARRDAATSQPKSREMLQDGGYTYPDLRTRLGNLIEAKFGRSAELSRRQRQAYEQPLENYSVFSFTPRDVGAIAGFPSSLLGTDIALDGGTDQ